MVWSGPKLFQANRVDPSFMRPAVFHCKEPKAHCESPFCPSESNASDLSGRPGLSDVGSIPGTLLQFTVNRQSLRKQEKPKSLLSVPANFTSKGSLAPLQTLIVLEPKADDDLCEVSVEVTGNSSMCMDSLADWSPLGLWHQFLRSSHPVKDKRGRWIPEGGNRFPLK